MCSITVISYYTNLTFESRVQSPTEKGILNIYAWNISQTLIWVNGAEVFYVPSMFCQNNS